MTFAAGDILACYGADIASRIITCGTCWPLDPWSCWAPPSHVGIISSHYGQPVLIESTTFCEHECLIRRSRVAGAQMHLPMRRIADYYLKGGRVDLYRLTEINRLSLDEEQELRTLLLKVFVLPGTHYDMRGALLSGTRSRKIFRRLVRADLNQVFCSELIAAVLMRLGRMTLEDPAIYSPGRLLRELLRIGVYRLQAREIPEDSSYPPLRLFDEQGNAENSASWVADPDIREAA